MMLLYMLYQEYMVIIIYSNDTVAVYICVHWSHVVQFIPHCSDMATVNQLNNNSHLIATLIYTHSA